MPVTDDVKAGIRLFYSMRNDLADSDCVREAVEEIRDIHREAKAERRKITDSEWQCMAELVEEACLDEVLPLPWQA